MDSTACTTTQTQTTEAEVAEFKAAVKRLRAAYDADGNEYAAWIDCQDCNDDGHCSERCAAIAEALVMGMPRRAA